MNRKIIWSKQAVSQRKDILKYWIIRNKSKKYSEKLNIVFDGAVNTLLSYPESGRQTQFVNIRMKIIKDYRAFYKVTEKVIFIIALVDTRRDPELIEKMLTD